MGAPGIKVSRAKVVAVADVLPFRPPIGVMWPRSGGRHIGSLDDYTLVMGPISCVALCFDDADSWARSVRVGTHADFTLPTLTELAVMVRTLPTLFGVPRLWSSDQIADVPADAMVYDVLTHDGIGWGKHFNLFAVAVRRESTKHWRSP